MVIAYGHAVEPYPNYLCVLSGLTSINHSSRIQNDFSCIFVRVQSNIFQTLIMEGAKRKVFAGDPIFEGTQLPPVKDSPITGVLKVARRIKSKKKGQSGSLKGKTCKNCGK